MKNTKLLFLEYNKLPNASMLEDCCKIKFKSSFEIDDAYTEVYDLCTDYTKSDDDILYIYPGCTVPRYKLKDRFKTTIKPSNANVVFMPTAITKVANKDLLEVESCNKIPIDKMIDFFRWNNFPQYVDKLKMLADNNNLSHIYINHGTTRGLSDSSYLSKYKFYDVLDTTSWRINSLIGSNTHYNEYYTQVVTIPFGSKLRNVKSNAKFYLESEILKYINEDSIAINWDKYNELKMLGNSEDVDNHRMLMQLIANCDYEKSTAYVLMLLKEFHKKIAAHKFVDSVNFKSVLNFFNLNKKDLDKLSIDKLAEILKSKSMFTRKNVQIIQSLCQGDYINYSNSTYFVPGPTISKSFTKFD
jgi:hypothetical protein